MVKISASMIAWNEENNIDLALRSIKGFADEVIVFDNNSWDNTVKKAREWIKKLNLSGQVIRGHACSCGQCRQRSIAKCSGDWIFLQDANLVVGRRTATRLRGLVNFYHNKQIVIGVKSINLCGDYSHYFTRQKYTPCHNSLFKAKGVLDFHKTIDRPVFRGYRKMEVRKPPMFNLSRVRPAWRCWYRGEPFRPGLGWTNRLNRQYHWCKVKKYRSIRQYVEKTQGLTLEDVKKLAPAWYLKFVRESARPLRPLRILPEVLREELKHPRFKLIYRGGKIRRKIVGRKPDVVNVR